VCLQGGNYQCVFAGLIVVMRSHNPGSHPIALGTLGMGYFADNQRFTLHIFR